MIRVLVVDDSVVIRRMMCDSLQALPDFAAVETAASSKIAMAKLMRSSFDVVLLDIEMANGHCDEILTTIRQANAYLPIILFSRSMTPCAGKAAFQSSESCATTYLTTPLMPTGLEAAKSIVQTELVPKIRSLIAQSRKVQKWIPSQITGEKSSITATNQWYDAVVVAASTGGPNALATIYSGFSQPLPVPVLIVQHMPPVFTDLLAKRLSLLSGGTVKEAVDGDVLSKASTLLAPGGFHMEIRHTPQRNFVSLNQEPPEQSCRPSADRLFRSAAEVFGKRVLAVVLTGMGQDGMRGCEVIRNAGGSVLAQDDTSAVVWGMPGAVVKAGLANEVYPLEKLADQIQRHVCSKAIR